MKQSEKIVRLVERGIQERDAGIAVDVAAIEIVTDEMTSEEFFEVGLIAHAASVETPLEAMNDILPATLGVYIHLVEKGFDYPLESVLFIGLPEEEPVPLLGYRTAVQWVREHIHGNLTLEQLCWMAFETAEQPDDYETAADNWVPEYPLDWRDVNPPDEIGPGREFDQWAGDLEEAN